MDLLSKQLESLQTAVETAKNPTDAKPFLPDTSLPQAAQIEQLVGHVHMLVASLGRARAAAVPPTTDRATVAASPQRLQRPTVGAMAALAPPQRVTESTVPLEEQQADAQSQAVMLKVANEVCVGGCVFGIKREK